MSAPLPQSARHCRPVVVIVKTRDCPDLLSPTLFLISEGSIHDSEAGNKRLVANPDRERSAPVCSLHIQETGGGAREASWRISGSAFSLARENGKPVQCSKAEEDLPHAHQDDNVILSMVIEAFTVVCGPPIGFGRVTSASVAL